MQAEQEHWRRFDDAAKNRYIIAGAHLPFPELGHVRNNGDNTYAFVPLNWLSPSALPLNRALQLISQIRRLKRRPPRLQ